MDKYFYCKELTFKLPNNFEGDFVKVLELMLEYSKTKEHTDYTLIGTELYENDATDIIELMDYRCADDRRIWVQTGIVEVDREKNYCKCLLNREEDDCAE